MTGQNYVSDPQISGDFMSKFNTQKRQKIELYMSEIDKVKFIKDKYARRSLNAATAMCVNLVYDIATSDKISISDIKELLVK